MLPATRPLRGRFANMALSLLWLGGGLTRILEQAAHHAQVVGHVGNI